MANEIEVKIDGIWLTKEDGSKKFYPSQRVKAFKPGKYLNLLTGKIKKNNG